MWSCFMLVTLTVLLFSQQAHPATFSIHEYEDAWVDSTDPNAVHNSTTDNYSYIFYNSPNVYQIAYIKFNLAGFLNSNTCVTGTPTLVLYNSIVSFENQTFLFNYVSPSSWSQTNLTYANQGSVVSYFSESETFMNATGCYATDPCFKTTFNVTNFDSALSLGGNRISFKISRTISNASKTWHYLWLVLGTVVAPTLSGTYDICSTNASCVNAACQCNAGFYGNGTANCFACDPTCKGCTTNSTTCTSCNPGTYLFNSQCITASCPTGYFQNNVTWTCDLCSANCSACFGSVANCTACSSPNILFNGTCYGGCPNGYYLNGGVCSALFLELFHMRIHPQQLHPVCFTQYPV